MFRVLNAIQVIMTNHKPTCWLLLWHCLRQVLLLHWHLSSILPYLIVNLSCTTWMSLCIHSPCLHYEQQCSTWLSSNSISMVLHIPEVVLYRKGWVSCRKALIFLYMHKGVLTIANDPSTITTDTLWRCWEQCPTKKEPISVQEVVFLREYQPILNAIWNRNQPWHAE